MCPFHSGNRGVLTGCASDVGKTSQWVVEGRILFFQDFLCLNIPNFLSSENAVFCLLPVSKAVFRPQQVLQ